MKRKPKRRRGGGHFRHDEAELRRIQITINNLPRLRNKYCTLGRSRRQRANAKVRSESISNEAERDDEVASAIAYNSKRFSDLPLSKKTLDGLAAASFTELTDVQRLAIPQALAGRDVLTAAPTGSGKTLAFVVPLVEALWRAKWGSLDGLGALILSPTRELSMQIFEVLCKLAKFHGFTAGAITGGTNITAERNVLGRLNILVATPGRLLQHMDEAPYFDCTTLQLLVLDEADRILDMGFRDTVDAILANLPKDKRQTLLFSATQTKSIRALGRLSLSNPEYVTIHSLRGFSHEYDDENKAGDSERDDQLRIAGIPSNLVQTYAVVDAETKLSIAWSFLRTHLKEKIIMFFSSCKQVRFVYEAFRRMRPGFPLLHMHGKMKQAKRVETYKRFVTHEHAALFATDIAARGLDFPAVHWVFQVDCPPDVESYVHRVGRTARFHAAGRALLLVNRGAEELFIELLNERNIHPKKAAINSKRIVTIDKKLSSICTTFQDVQHLAKRAIVSYLRALDLRGDSDVFNAGDLDSEALARSYGLPVAPRIVFRNADKTGTSTDAKNAKRKKRNIYGYHLSNDAISYENAEPKSTRQDGGFEKGNEDDKGNDELLTLRRVHAVERKTPQHIGDTDSSDFLRKRTRARPQRISWNEDGEIMQADKATLDPGHSETSDPAEYAVKENVANVSKRLKLAEREIRSLEKDRVRKMRVRRKKLEGPQHESISLLDDERTAVLEDSEVEKDALGEESSTSSGDLEEEDSVGEDLDKQAAMALQILETR